MLEKIRQTIEGKKVLILGFGREGRSSLRLVCKAGGWERLAVSDLREVDPSKEAGGCQVELYTGEHYMDRELLDSFDIVFKTPGIVLPEEVEGVVHRLALQIGLDLLHGEVQPPEIPDHVQLVHLLQGVEAVAVGIPPGL